MTTREKFKRAVIEAIHGLPYEEAVRKEIYTRNCKFLYKRNFGICQQEYKVICTIDRIDLDYQHKQIHFHYVRPGDAEINDEIFWIKHKNAESGVDDSDKLGKIKIIGLPVTIGRILQALPANIGIDSSGTILIGGAESEYNWKLIEENGEESTDDFQDDATIEALYNLLK